MIKVYFAFESVTIDFTKEICYSAELENKIDSIQVSKQYMKISIAFGEKGNRCKSCTNSSP